ncbi:uncharacterized protein [Triticum aestivum]|uniref:uncharacterized protein isoform X2 n=1 Tax=Triticum aestivum TaxID=4565 RepID=UPI001D033F5C|nr:uncharacterized protein LOC123139206 isoform X2 [Triticum aestivum]
MTDVGEDDKWLGDELVDAVIQIMRHDHPNDIRDGQLVYIEMVAGVAMLERDGKVENCHEAALAGSHGTTKGDNYLRHDLVLLPTNMANTHWFLVVVNPRRREIQILDSLFGYLERTQVVHVIRGVEAHLRASLRINGPQSHAWQDINVTQWTVKHVRVPRQDDNSSCALYMLKNIEFFMGEDLRLHYDQAYIDNYRRELPVVLLNSTYNKLKSMKRLKSTMLAYRMQLQLKIMKMQAFNPAMVHS